MKEWTFEVEHLVSQKTLITVRADRYEQAESNMLQAGLDQKMDIIDWTEIKKPG